MNYVRILNSVNGYMLPLLVRVRERDRERVKKREREMLDERGGLSIHVHASLLRSAANDIG